MLGLLESVNLSNNRLEWLDNRLFEQNRQLTRINLSGNKFMELPNEPILRSKSIQVSCYIHIHSCAIFSRYIVHSLLMPYTFYTYCHEHTHTHNTICVLHMAFLIPNELTAADQLIGSMQSMCFIGYRFA